MADGQDIKPILDPLKVGDDVKANAWDAYHSSANSQDFTNKFSKVNVPDEVKAQLWDMKFGAGAQQAQQQSEAAKQEGAYQKKRGGPILNAGTEAEREFIRNPKAQDTFGGGGQQQGLLDSLTQPQQGEGPMTRGAKGLARVATGIVQTPIKLAAPPTSGEETAAAIGGPGGVALKRGLFDPFMSATQNAADAFDNISKAPDWQSKGLLGAEGVLHTINSILPVVGSMSESAMSSAKTGDTAGAITEGVGNVGTLALGAKKAGEVGTTTPTKIGKVVGKPAPPEASIVGREALNLPNKQVLQHASQEGIKLTPEQAKGEISGKQGMAEQARFGGEELKQATATSRAQLSAKVNDFADRLDPQSRGLSEGSAGQALQADAKVMKDVTNTNASNAYKQLPWTQSTQVSPAPITSTWMQWRGKLPMGVEEQIMAKVPRELAAPVQEMLSPTGMKNPIPFDQMIQLRSVFRDLGGADGADLPGKTQAAFRALEKATDGSMDNAANGVSKQAAKDWRKANEGWADYKQKFGDPQSPLYKILSTKDPVKVTRTFLNNASEGDVATLKDAISKTVPKAQAQSAIDAALAPLRRQVIQDIANNGFKMGRDGLGGYSNAFLNQMFNPADLKELYLKSEIGRRLQFDVNPSRTAKVTSAAEQQTSPFSALQPVKTAGTLAKYSLAAKKMMPRDVTPYLTQPPSRLRLAPPLMAGMALPRAQESQTKGLLPSGSP